MAQQRSSSLNNIIIMKRKKYIQPKVNTESMQICNILAGTYEKIGVGDSGEEAEGGDAKMFGGFDYYEDEDY